MTIAPVLKLRNEFRFYVSILWILFRDSFCLKIKDVITHQRRRLVNAKVGKCCLATVFILLSLYLPIVSQLLSAISYTPFSNLGVLS